jgi:hypothetical protein
MKEAGINPEAFVQMDAIKKEKGAEAAAKAERIKQFRENNNILYEGFKNTDDGDRVKKIIEDAKYYVEAALDDYFEKKPEKHQVSFSELHGSSDPDYEAGIGGKRQNTNYIRTYGFE